jgi:hypothetical protein
MAKSDGPLKTETLDISNNGFYCITTRPFVPGEKLTCLIGMPGRSSSKLESKSRFYLEAEVKVVRIVVNSGSGFGVGCRISDYRVLARDAIPSWVTAPAEETMAAAAIEQMV